VYQFHRVFRQLDEGVIKKSLIAKRYTPDLLDTVRLEEGFSDGFHNVVQARTQAAARHDRGDHLVWFEIQHSTRPCADPLMHLDFFFFRALGVEEHDIEHCLVYAYHVSMPI
jgi:hypothetical protein